MFRKIHVNGYRLLSDFEAELRPINIVVGANASGKSTLIDFLLCISELMQFGIQEVIDFHGGLWAIKNAGDKRQTTCEWKLEFEKPNTITWAPIPLGNPGEHFIYEVKIVEGIPGELRAEREELSVIRTSGGQLLLKAEGDRSAVFNERTGKLEPFDEALSSTDAIPNNSPPTPVPSPDNLAGQNKGGRTLMLAQMRFAGKLPMQSWVRTLLGNQAFYPGFDVTRASALRTKAADIRPHTTLTYNGENLGTVLHEILTRYDYRATAEQLKDFLRTAYPEFEDITAETSYGAQPKVLVRLRERGMTKSMEVWELSDGTLRFLCLATALLNPTPPALVALDEPELGLHPKLFPIVADLLKMAAEQSQLIVTTHSPDLLNQFELDNIAVLTREGTNAKWHRPSTNAALQLLLKDVGGDRIGDLHRAGELEAGV